MNQITWKAFQDELQKIAQFQSGPADWLRRKAAVEAPPSVRALTAGAPGFQPMNPKFPGKVDPLLKQTGVTRMGGASIR